MQNLSYSLKQKKYNERQKQIEILIEIYDKNGISRDNLKTHIEIHSDDITGQKILVHKRDYSMADVVSGNADDRFFVKLRDIIQKELHLSYEKVVHLLYPDYFYDTNYKSKKLTITIINRIEK